jgi:hypothetical protein
LLITEPENVGANGGAATRPLGFIEIKGETATFRAIRRP